LANDAVTIQAGHNVTLDVSPPALESVMVHGQLVFSNSLDLSVTSKWIMVMGANSLLQIGTETTKYARKATITLTGTNEAENIVGTGITSSGTKFIMAMEGGRLELHGASASDINWTVLAQQANPGATRIVLAAAPGWDVGDQIAIASSSFETTEAEKVTLTAISGTTVDFTPALQYTHSALVETYSGKTLDMRAEVGRLTHNIVIQGADDSLASNFGGHVMVMAGGVAHLEGVEFYRMGQMGHRGRYPFHWHLVNRLGDGTSGGAGQYARKCSVHASFQRGFAIHGTQGALLENNVTYDVWNHAYIFAEDGDEFGNTLRNNLAIHTKHLDGRTADWAFFYAPSPNEPKSIQEEHRGISGFWGRNPYNILEGNVVAGVDQGMGYFFDGDVPPEHVPPTYYFWIPADNKFIHHDEFETRFGLQAKNARIDEERSLGYKIGPIASFRFFGNKAHSIGGFAGFYPLKARGFALFYENNSTGQAHINMSTLADLGQPFTYDNFTSYKIKANAYWSDSNTTLRNSILADTGFMATFIRAKVLVENSVIVGYSGNTLGNSTLGSSPGAFGRPRTAFNHQKFNTEVMAQHYRNIDIHNITDALYFEDYHDKSGPEDFFAIENINFFNVTNILTVGDISPLVEGWMHDRDGSVFSQAGKYYFRTDTFVPDPASGPQTLSPTDDAQVYGASANVNTNYGSLTTLRARSGSSAYITYLQFDLTSLPQVSSAKLRLNLQSIGGTGSNPTVTVYAVTNDAWDESTLTYTNRPAYGAAANSQIVSTAGYYEWDITALASAAASGDNILSIAVFSNSTRTATFGSKEGSAGRPELVVVP
jgi:hypothetical protein